MPNSGSLLTHSNMETHIVKNIQFGLLNPEEIIRMSVCKVERIEVIDREGLPMTNGINDCRMGIVDKTLNCKTCHSDFTDCPGHFGHIELARPMFHIGFIESVRKILRCVCFQCSKLLIPKDSKFKQIMKIKNPKKRQLLMFNLCKNKSMCTGDLKLKNEKHNKDTDTEIDATCDNTSLDGELRKINNLINEGCKFKQPKYKKDKIDPMKIVAEFPQQEDEDENLNNPDSNRTIKPEDCLRILKKISDEDCKALGFDPERARPEWMLLTVLAVCPPQVRPSVSVDATLRSEDDLTFQYVQILKANQLLTSQEKNGAPEHVIDETSALLQFYVATLMNNEIPSASSQQRSGRPIKAISSRLKGKEGRLRGNLMGKRVDFSARTVITPDPNLSLDQLGVPKSIAMNLTFPEVVTPHNIDYLRKLIENGPTEWPGAKYIVRDDNVRIDLRYLKKRSDVHLSYGYTVERHMQDNDYVLFNRQPSLHKMSIMGHRVKILPYSTFRLNLSVTSPYNADFDGDEMNMHLPQSWETKAEIAEIMHVPRQIVSPQSNKPVMGIVQDSCIGVHMFTKRNVFLTFDQVMDLLMWLTDWDGILPNPAILKPKPLWTGKQIFSMILPKNINMNNIMSAYDSKNDNKFNYYDTIILIEKGELIQGTVCKKTVGNPSGGLVHLITNENGCMKTMYFFNNTQKIVNQWILLNGWTVGVSDIISDQETSIKIRETMEETKQSVNNILKEVQQGILKCQPGKSMFELFEVKVNEELNKARDVSGNYVLNNIHRHNHLKNMVTSGSKGSTLNISQIIACVGQQNVEGKRIPMNFNRRSLPHFTKDDFGPESRGFVENSYLSGLTPQEFFFHAMGGREGLIDTAVKTSETGYIQRRLVKALEDVMVKYDGTVRNSNGAIVQFLYGEDGMNAELIEDQPLETLKLDNKSLNKKYNFLSIADIEILNQLAANTKAMEEYTNFKLSQKQGFAGTGLTTILGEDDDYLLNDNNDLENDNEFAILKKTDIDLNNKLIESLRKQLIHTMDNKVINELLYENFPLLKLKLEEEYNQIIKDRDELRNNIYANLDVNKGHFPVNIPRIKWNAKKSFNITNVTKSDLSPLYIIEEKEKLKKRLILVVGDDYISKEMQACGTKMFNIILNYYLNTKRLILFHKITKVAFEWIIGEIESKFIQAILKPGEMVGSIAAQSIGEPATQMTLNTFHFAGVSAKNVTLGVPRLKEIINVAKNLKTPMMTIYLKNDLKTEQKAAIKVKNLIELSMLKDVVINTMIVYDPDPTTTIIQEDFELMSMHASFHYETNEEFDPNSLSRWVLRIKLSEPELNNKSISSKFIKEKIEAKYPNFEVIATQINDIHQVIRIRSKYDMKEGKIYTHEESMSDYILQHLESSLLRDLHLLGIPAVKKVFVQQSKIKRYDPITGVLDEKQQEWEILTDGTNIKEIFLIDEVDYRRVTSNDITEIYDCLGIEAVRNSLIRELRKVLGPYGIYVNYRHLAVLCDVMTQGGYLTSITRHGINRVEQGPLRKCSFEETVEILLEAGLFSETDYLKGISENIMLGQLAPFGTGYFDLMLDFNKIKNAEYIQNNMSLINDTINNDGNIDNNISTPFINNNITNSPSSSTPFNMNTPRPGLNPAFTPMTVRGNSTPIFTPNRMDGRNNSDSFNMNSNNYSFANHDSDNVVNIINSPYVNNAYDAVASPGYRKPYSPIYDSDINALNDYSSKYANNMNSGNQYNSVINSPTTSIPMKSPYLTNVGYKDNSSPTYSPSTPVPHSTRQVGGYNYANSPSYNLHSSNNLSYSPTTPVNHRGISPEYNKSVGYYNARSSNYEMPMSPAMGQSPHSPSYNPKSPAYMMSATSK